MNKLIVTALISMSPVLCFAEGRTSPSEAERVALLIAIYDSEQPAARASEEPYVKFMSLGDAMKTGYGAVLYFDGGPTCKYCKILKDDVFNKPRVIEALSRHNMVMCDLEDAEFWGVKEFPSFMTIRPNGQRGTWFPSPHTEEELVDLFTPKKEK